MKSVPYANRMRISFSLYTTMTRLLFCSFLIINILHLSVDVWDLGSILTEMNEEIEEVIEDSVVEDVIVELSQGEMSTPLSSIADISCQRHTPYAMHGAAFEIDSPPPEWV